MVSFVNILFENAFYSHQGIPMGQGNQLLNFAFGACECQVGVKMRGVSGGLGQGARLTGLGNFSAHNQSPRASPAVHNQSVMRMVMIVVVTVLIDDISSIEICLQM